MEDVIILGTGCAGLTAAIYAGRAQLNPLVLEGSQPGGQLTTTSEVENFPGFPEGTDGFAMMDNLRKQAARFGARYEHAKVESIEVHADHKVLHAGEKMYKAKAVIIATGARPRLLGIQESKRCIAKVSRPVPPVMALFIEIWKLLWSVAATPLLRKLCF